MSGTTGAEAIVVAVGDGGYRFEVGDDGRLHQIGFGPTMPDRAGLPVGVFPLAYPTWGESSTRAPGLRVTHHDGSTITRLRYEQHQREAHDHGEVVRIRLVDPVEPITVTLVYRTSTAHQVVEQWVEIRNDQPGPVVLHEVAAAVPAWWGAELWLTHHAGGWAAEWGTHEQRLTPGTLSLESYGGIRPSLQRQPFFLLSVGGPSTETEGRVLAGALAWGGNVRMAFERGNPMDTVTAWCGANPVGAELVLDPGAVHVTPRMVWAWSDAGRAPLTHRLHRWVRDHSVRDGDRRRDVVANNWEATFFAFDQRKLLSMMDDAADLGAELFLLDDGWFGERHPRDDDTAGLGDWVVDRKKLPDGIGALTDGAAERGLRFGLWVEPEMVNAASELYEARPDWVVHVQGRDRREERQQLVLDLCRPEVRDFVVATVDRILTEHPGISYLKWDANRDISEPASAAIPPDRQASYWVELALATEDVMRRVAEGWPDVELMLCASGGGRVDLASLQWFHEVWLSDNTDPVDRVRMQWAASHYLPAKVIGAHVTRWGGRPIELGCAVAMGGRFGFDLDTAGLSDDERAVCRRAAAFYRDHRDVLQEGDLHRLISPLGGDRAALMYADPDGGRAVVLGYQLEAPGDDTSLVVLAGLDAEGRYAVSRIDLTGLDDPATEERSGDTLMTSGIDWPLTEAATAAIWEIRRV